MGILPFLKNKNEGGASASEAVERKPDQSSDEYDMLEAAADELIAAVHAKDTKAVCAALRSAFQMLEGESYE